MEVLKEYLFETTTSHSWYGSKKKPSDAEIEEFKDALAAYVKNTISKIKKANNDFKNLCELVLDAYEFAKTKEIHKMGLHE
jgi:hypothetical protein